MHGLRTIVFAPNVQHEDGSDEEQRHDQHGYGTNFDTGRVVRVETPHATSSGTAGCTTPGRCGAGGGLALLQGAAASGSGATWRRQFAGGARSAAHGR